MEEEKVYWISIDPVRCKIDPYPYAIAQRIEKKYNDNKGYINELSPCVLGSDFFNATIHFNLNGKISQTTPGFDFGRSGFKQPGYRSVQRLIINENQTTITVFIKKFKREWRLANSQEDSECSITEIIDINHIINNKNENTINYFDILSWKPDDLNSNEDDRCIALWEWCRGVHEKQGDLMKLSNDWWVSYLFHQNEIIETSFKNKEEQTQIKLENETNNRIIQFIPNSIYGKQIKYENNRTYIRLIRRRIINIKELKEKIYKLNTLLLHPSKLEEIINSEEIPNEFYCSISQEIMFDPVKTCDGHTYDKKSIITWFKYNITSPLTGLKLDNLNLIPNYELKTQIETFIKEKTNKLNVMIN